LTIGLISLVLPAGTVLGAPIRAYELLLASFGSWAGPFRQWQDYYIALAGIVNVTLFLVVPMSLVWGLWRGPLAAIAGLGAAYVISFSAVFPTQTNAAYFGWLAAVICAAYGCLQLARQATR